MAGIIINGVVAIEFAAPMSVISNKPVYSGDTMSLQRLTYGQSAQRWEIKTNLMPTNSNADFFAHSVMNNFDGVFDIRMPQPYRGNIARNTSVINATGTAGAGSVNITGNTGTLRKGDFVRFTSDNKTYMITADITGNGTMGIFPKLKRSIVGVLMEHDDTVNFKATYDSTNVLGMIYTDGILSDPGSITFIEVV